MTLVSDTRCQCKMEQKLIHNDNVLSEIFLVFSHARDATFGGIPLHATSVKSVGMQ